MPAIFSVTLDQLIIALLASVALREALVLLLPPALVGPEGLLLRTGADDARR